MVNVEKMLEPKALFKAAVKAPDSYKGITLELVDEMEGGASLVLPWTMTYDYLHGDPDKDSTRRATSMVGAQMSNDLCDLGVNGDVDNVDSGLLHAMDGLKKLGRESGTLQIVFDETDVDERDMETKFSIRLRVKLV